MICGGCGFVIGILLFLSLRNSKFVVLRILAWGIAAWMIASVALYALILI